MVSQRWHFEVMDVIKNHQLTLIKREGKRKTVESSEHKQAEESLRENAEKFDAVLRFIGDPMSMLDKDLNIVWANETSKKIFGNDIIGKKCYEVCHRRKEPCESCIILQSFQDGGIHEHETQVIGKDGQTIWFHCIANVVLKDHRGNPTAVLKISRDITKHKQVEKTLRESEEKYKTLTESSLTGIFIHQDGKYVFVNDKFAEIHGYRPQELLGKDYLTLIHPDEREALREIASKRLEGKAVPQRYEVRRLRKDGKTIWCQMMATRIDYRGKPAIMGNIIDITKQRQMEEVLKASEQKYRNLYKKAKILAEKDPLTKLLNHRRINELLENEIQRAKRKEEVFSIMMLDVDDLKLINDTYGHLTGDKVLKNIAHILKNSCRSIDLIGRYGGDEFLIILPYTHREGAKNVAQRICEKIQKQGLKINRTKNTPVRLSIGVATYPFDGMVSQKLIGLADRRMYESKRFGESVISATTPEVKGCLADKKSTLGGLEVLINAVNGKDYYTKAHSELVRRFSLSLGKEVNLSSEELEALEIASLLHDIGKIAIPESILRKPGPLEREEFKLIKQHPILGAMMLEGISQHRDKVIDAIRYHHERYDGKGYPGELKGKDIPLFARIIGIVDAYCAMITDRPYRKALTQEEAIAELRKDGGTQFDPELVDKFIKCLKKGNFSEL